MTAALSNILWYSLGSECRSSDVSMLASQIASLAGLWCLDLACVQLTTVGGVKMTHRSGAVAISWNCELVNVVN